jgi:hypothetical protein
MNRADVASHLGLWFSTYLSETGLTAVDNSANLGPVIDATFRAMGFNEADLATAESDDVQALLAQAEYRLMLLIVNRLGAEIDLGISGDSYRLEQVWQHAQKKLEECRALVEELFGSSLEDSSSSSVDGPFVYIDENFLEPVYP